MKIMISRDGDHLVNADVDSLTAVPSCVFAASEHYGSGEYVVRAGEDLDNGIEKNEPLFRLATEWLEPEVA